MNLSKLWADETLVPILVCASLFLLALAPFLYFHASNWPRADDFVIVDLFSKLKSGELSVVDVIKLKNQEHLLGIYYISALWLAAAFGLNFALPIILNGLLILASVLLLAFTMRRHHTCALRWPAIAALFMAIGNGTQVNHLLWAFELYWYVVLFLHILLIFVIEKYGSRAAVPVLVVCAASTLFGAQGQILWLTSAAHYWLRASSEPNSNRRVVFAVVATKLLAFSALAVMYVTNSSSGQIGFLFDRLLSLPIFFLQLFGGLFGIRHPGLALVLGTLVVGITIVLLVRNWLIDRNEKPFRVASSLVLFALIWAGLFAVGRSKLGIDWAFGNFHASVHLIPILLALALLACTGDSADSRGWSAASSVALTVPFVAFFTALTYAGPMSREVRDRTSVAMALTCHEGSSSNYAVLRLNGMSAHRELFERGSRVLYDLCRGSEASALAKRLLSPPDDLLRMMKTSEEADLALTRLWQVYVSSFDLQRAFSPWSPSLVADLLEFGYHTARSEAMYESAFLGPHRATLIQVRDEYLKVRSARLN